MPSLMHSTECHSYLFATGSNPYILNVTAAGTYTIVNVSDANCTKQRYGTTPVSYFPKPTGTISGTAEMCKGGSATLTMTFTGTAPYTFTYTECVLRLMWWDILQNVYTVSVSPLINTTYTLTSLTDGNSCAGVVSGSAVITINVPPVPTLTGTNLICNGINTGAVSMAIAGERLLSDSHGPDPTALLQTLRIFRRLKPDIMQLS